NDPETEPPTGMFSYWKVFPPTSTVRVRTVWPDSFVRVNVAGTTLQIAHPTNGNNINPIRTYFMTPPPGAASYPTTEHAGKSSHHSRRCAPPQAEDHCLMLTFGWAFMKAEMASLLIPLPRSSTSVRFGNFANS